MVVVVDCLMRRCRWRHRWCVRSDVVVVVVVVAGLEAGAQLGCGYFWLRVVGGTFLETKIVSNLVDSWPWNG